MCADRVAVIVNGAVAETVRWPVGKAVAYGVTHPAAKSVQASGSQIVGFKEF